MSLQLRPARIDDLPRVHELVARGSRGLYTPATLVRMPRLWADWLRQRRIEMHVFVDDRLPPAQRIQLVASGVFVRDEFADRTLAAYRCGLAERLVAEELQGHDIVLDRSGQARANANQGVSAIGLDFALARDDWSVPAMLRWTPLLVESLRLWVDGWRLRLGLREVIGRDLFMTSRAMGTPVFDRHVREGGRLLPPRERRYLVGMTRRQAQRLPAALQSMLFFHDREPRFGFGPGEQDLLGLALRRHNDDECAALLNVSPHTVKMRWRSIFVRVAQQQPDWFPSDAGDAAGRITRGVEKRRHLLAYLQSHMEEVRPRSTEATKVSTTMAG